MPDRRQHDRRESSFLTRSIKIPLVTAVFIIIIVAIICLSIFASVLSYKKGFNKGYDNGYSDGFSSGQEYSIRYEEISEYQEY